MADPSQRQTVGRIGSPYGVHGWLRVHSYTSPPEQILRYRPWWLKTRHGLKAVEPLSGRPHGESLVVHLPSVTDREGARALVNTEIAVDTDQFPPLEPGEYYWHQLIGLTVVSHYGGERTNLGRIIRLMETGANDVLVVKGEPGDRTSPSVDSRERLIPYLPEQVVTAIDLDDGVMSVDWDPAF